MSGCMTCFFCVTDNDDPDDDYGGYGICKRFPPVLSPMSDKEQEEFETNANGVWQGRYEYDIVPWVQPRVFSEDWCGEYRERKS